ncbi:MAG: hypothetical protein KAQ96_11820, partial [Thermoplasmata archaeon]|nr:hypothetical protein [Thermoplasmata archaeon]
EGYGYFTIDIVELISGDLTIRDEVRIMNRSYYVEDGDVTIENSVVLMEEGAGSIGAGTGAVAYDQLSESLTPDGEFAGTYMPYQRSATYGTITLNSDEDYVLSGDYSIKNSGINTYGFSYWFDDVVDLTEYNYFTFWYKSDNSINYHTMIYLYGSEQSTAAPLAYVYNYYNGYEAANLGWYGISYSLDLDNVHYNNIQGGFTMSEVWGFQVYAYGYQKPLYFDHIGFNVQEEPGDPICEGVVNGGDMGGKWSTTSKTAPRTSSRAFVGESSVEFYIDVQANSQDITYTFNKPVDLSAFDSLRMYTYLQGYYYVYSLAPNFYVYSVGGDGHYKDYPSKWMHYYATYQSQNWDMKSYPWGPNSGLYEDNNLDWTQITGFMFNDVYTFGSYWMQLDGLDFVSRTGVAKRPTDTVSHAIYNKDGNTIIQESTISGLGFGGARILTENGNARFNDSTFNNIWATTTKSAGNGLNIIGGLEVYGDVVADHITFTNCMGPGLAIFDGQFTLDRDTIDLRGTAQGMKKAPMIIMGLTEKTTGQVTYDISGWDLQGSPRGTGMMLMFLNTRASIDVTVTGNDFDANGYAGLAISNHGGS